MPPKGSKCASSARSHQEDVQKIRYNPLLLFVNEEAMNEFQVVLRIDMFCLVEEWTLLNYKILILMHYLWNLALDI